GPIPGTSQAFDVCTRESLAMDSPTIGRPTFTLVRGATPQQPIGGMFSFVPCRRWSGDESRFARPAVRLPGITNPRSRQSPSGAKFLRPRQEVAAAWRAVIDQVLAADL